MDQLPIHQNQTQQSGGTNPAAKPLEFTGMPLILDGVPSGTISFHMQLIWPGSPAHVKHRSLSIARHH
jgi:hypothetical protein